MKKYTDNITKLQEEEIAKINEAGETRIRLDESDFVTLVSGGEFDSKKEGGSGAHVKIILADIGYDRMIQIITDLKNKM